MSRIDRTGTPRRATACVPEPVIGCRSPAYQILPSELEKAFLHLAREPASGSPRYAHQLGLADLRFWPLGRLPYLVFYVERDDHIDIWRVLHERRDIPAWMDEG